MSSRRRRRATKRQPTLHRALPPAGELERWSYCIVERDAALPPRVHAFAIVDATHQLIAAGVERHDLVGFAARDDRGEIDPTDGSYRGALADVGATVRFRGPRVIAAWLAATVITDATSGAPPPTPTVGTWRAIAARARRRDATLRALELMRGDPDAALARSWRAAAPAPPPDPVAIR